MVSTRYWDSVQTTVEASAPTPEVCSIKIVTANCDWDVGGACSGDVGCVCNGKVVTETPAPTPEVPV